MLSANNAFQVRPPKWQVVIRKGGDAGYSQTCGLGFAAIHVNEFPVLFRRSVPQIADTRSH